MRLSWFRLHTEARTDAKLRALTAEQFRVWFNLLCLAAEQDESRGSVTDTDLDLLAIEVSDGDVALLEQTLARLIKLRIISQSDETVAFINFEKRQYEKPSDYPDRVRARVKRHRERQETPGGDAVTPSNADVTPRNAYIQIRTDTEQTQSRTDPPPRVDISNGRGSAPLAADADAPPPAADAKPAVIVATNGHIASAVHRVATPQATTPATPASRLATLAPPGNPNARARPPNPLWDALVELMGFAPETKTERSKWGGVVHQLRDAGATPEDVRQRGALYRTKMGNDRQGKPIALTVTALLNHWSELVPDALKASNGHGADQAAAAKAKADAEYAALLERRRILLDLPDVAP